MGRTASGVRGVRLRDGDAVVGMTIADENAYLLSVCERGYGKRTAIGPNGAPCVDESSEDQAPEDASDEGTDAESSASKITYRAMRRGGQGVLDVKTTARNGKVVDVLRVDDGDEIMTITAAGKIQRFSVDDVRVVGRNTQGVRLMNVDKGDVVVAVNRIPREEIDASEKTTLGATSTRTDDSDADAEE